MLGSAQTCSFCDVLHHRKYLWEELIRFSSSKHSKSSVKDAKCLFSLKAPHPFAFSPAHKHARVYIWACVQNTDDLVCVKEQVCIYMVFLHLDPCRLPDCKWSAETDRCSHLVIGVHLKCLSVSKLFLIDLWPCFFLPPHVWQYPRCCWGVWVREWECVWNISKVSWNSSAEPEWCTHSSPHALWWCNVLSVSETARRTQLQHSASAEPNGYI